MHATATSTSATRAGTATDYAVTLLDADGLCRLDSAQWDALAASAIDENPFYARRYLLAGLATIDAGAAIRAVAIHHDSTLVGLLPFRMRHWPLARARAAGNLYQFSNHPLIHRDHAQGAIAAWMDAIATGSIPRRWTFRHLDQRSQFVRLCQLLGNSAGFDILPSGGYARASLVRRGQGFEAHLAGMSRSRVRDIQRSIRRLEEQGALRFERARDPDLVAQRIEDFLAIEHGGWKGVGGTSFLSNPLHADFARMAFAGSDTERCSVDSLLLDGRPIAVSLNLQTGDTIFTPKCAYDEAWRKCCPGLVLEYFVMEAFYGEDCLEMDSATTVDGHVIAGLWNASKPMGTVLIGPRGVTTRALAFAQQQAVASREAVKAVLGGGKLRGFATAMRSWHQRMAVARHNFMVGGVSLIHAVETLLPVI
jgi:CelD/BcsL family acetyltransferase involved in cellulose biosynthesis